MSEVVRPTDLEPLKKPLIQSVINAYMRHVDLSVEGESAFRCKGGSCAEGRFDFYVEDGYDAAEFYCDYPSGAWHQSRVLWDNDYDAGETVYETPLFDVKAKYDEIEQLVSEWVDPWINDCQSPNVFTNQIASIADIIEQLYVQDEVRVGGQQVTSVGNGAAQSTSSPVSDIRTAISDMGSYLDDLAGGAIDALQMAYVNDIGLTISGQRALATAAGLTIAGEAMAWNSTYRNLRTLFTDAATDFNAFAESGSGSGQNIATGFAIVSGVTTIGAGATAAFPPFAGPLTAVAGVSALGAALWPVEAAREPTEIVLSGSSFEDYWASFTEGVRAVDLELTYAEQELTALCNNVLTDCDTNPDSYSITMKSSNGSPQANDNLNGFLSAQIDISPTKMRGVAGAIESIGDHQRGVAGLFGGTDASGDPASFVKNEWSRGSLPTGVTMGSGDFGPYADFSNVIDALVELLIMESKTAHRIAEHCIEIARDFTGTDQEVGRDLESQATKYDTVPIPGKIGLSGD